MATQAKCDCPDEDVLARHAEGRASEAESVAVRAHIESCAGCRRLVSELLKSMVEDVAPAPDAGVAEAPLPRGTQVGRYVVLKLIGAGAMGMVYAAYDPDLERKVALKLLSPARGGDAPELEQRLVREAKAMAQLSHPNVVSVHDVGVSAGRVFIAMELVQGRSLRDWLLDRRRGWREVVAVFVQAGRGLDAAHRAGLVHRDFKPENVFMSHDGRVLVGDFGLAHLEAEGQLRGEAAPLPALPSLLTQTGMLLGTPAYMAPEQIAGDPVDARTDLFAFCVALWEALYGTHPFEVTTLAALRAALLAGRVREPPKGRRVPAHVHGALARGLRRDPDARFTSMEPLLTALERDPRRRLGWILAGGAIAAGLVVLAVSSAARRATPCTGGAARLATVWNPERRAAAAAAFAATGSPLAAHAWARAAAALDRYAGGWTAAYLDACQATRVRGEQSESLLDRRMQCLDGRLQDLGALVDTFARADPQTVENAVTAASEMRPLASCADRERLLTAVPPPEDPAAAARVADGHGLVARARASRAAGRYAAALAPAGAALAVAGAARYAPLEADALLELGTAELRRRDVSDAEPMLRDAARAALAGRDDALAAAAEIQLVKTLGWSRKTEDALRLAALAAGQVARAGDAPVLRAQLFEARGVTYQRNMQNREALADFRRALALWQQLYGDEDPRVARALNYVAAALGQLSENQEALDFAERSHAVYERTLGPDHPDTVNEIAFSAIYLRNLYRLEEALAKAKLALRRRIQLLGPDHPLVASAHGTVGDILAPLGRYQEAVRHFDRAVTILENSLGADHPELMTSLGLRAVPLARLGRTDEALASLQRMRAIGKKDGMQADNLFYVYATEIEGQVLEIAGRNDEAAARFRAAIDGFARIAPDSTDPDPFDGLGRILARHGRFAEALARHDRALVLAERAAGRGHAFFSELGRARCLLGLGRVGEARQLAQSLARRMAAAHIDPEAVAEVRFVWAETLWPQPGERERARALARHARAAVVGTSVASRELASEISAWLASRR